MSGTVSPLKVWEQRLAFTTRRSPLPTTQSSFYCMLTFTNSHTHTHTHTSIHWWQGLPYKVPTCQSGFNLNIYSNTIAPHDILWNQFLPKDTSTGRLEVLGIKQLILGSSAPSTELQPILFHLHTNKHGNLKYSSWRSFITTTDNLSQWCRSNVPACTDLVLYWDCYVFHLVFLRFKYILSHLPFYIISHLGTLSIFWCEYFLKTSKEVVKKSVC